MAKNGKRGFAGGEYRNPGPSPHLSLAADYLSV